jgi:nucleotide-binding universal stress UspA family protein
MKRIVVAIDGSPTGSQAVAVGVELASQEGAEVCFVYVVPEVPAGAFQMVSVPHETAPPDDAPLRAGLRYAELHSVLAGATLLSGDTVDEIVAFADSIDADLIVLGSRGRGALTSALLGSTSRGVISESRRPVLVVRGEAPSVPRAAAFATR